MSLQLLLGGHAERLSNDAADNGARFVKNKDSRPTAADSPPAATDCRLHMVAVGDNVHVEFSPQREERERLGTNKTPTVVSADSTWSEFQLRVQLPD